MSLTQEQQEMLSRFKEFVSVDDEDMLVAFLTNSNWNLEQAIQQFFDTPAGAIDDSDDESDVPSPHTREEENTKTETSAPASTEHETFGSTVIRFFSYVLFPFATTIYALYTLLGILLGAPIRYITNDLLHTPTENFKKDFEKQYGITMLNWC